MADEPEPTEAREESYVLPRYLRFARTLALVSGAAVGIAAGVAVISSSGCVCSGTPCGGPVAVGVRPIPTDAADATADLGRHEDSRIAPTDAVADGGARDDASDTGGGPRPAPLLPRAWMA